MNILAHLHWTIGIAPVADAFAGTVATDVVRVTGEGFAGQITKGVGLLGTSTITVEACDDVTPTTTSAVPFIYRAMTTADTWGAWTQAAATGFTTTAGSNQMYEIYADATEAATLGYAYMRIKAVEVVNDPVLGGINLAVVNTRYIQQPSTLLT